MLRVILNRLLLSVPMLLITSMVTFVLMTLIPGDPARAIVGLQADPTTYERVREQLDLDSPLWERYGNYLLHAVQGDLGTSLFTGEPVAQSLANRLPVTLSVIAGATLLGAIVGILFGIASARLGGALARAVDVVSLLGQALPNFWLALLLVSAFAVALPILPATGYVPFETDPSMWAASLVLPVIALAIGNIALIAKVTRDGVSNALEQDYSRTLRAAGIGERSILWRHALKNSGVTIITVVGLAFIGSLAASIFVESVFVLPGLGSLVNDATNRQDVPVVQGVALAYALVVIVVNLIVDISYAYLNPKVRVR